MKTPYIYFGTKGYYYESDSGADQYIAGNSATSLTLAAAGMVPVDHTAGTANVSTSTDAFRIIVKSDGTESSAEMGSAYTTFFIDDEGNRNSTSGFVSTKPQAGNAVSLNAGAWGVASSGQITLIAYSADGTNGYLIDATDQWIIRELITATHGSSAASFGGVAAASTNAALYATPAIQQTGMFNMSNYLGCDPVDTSTAAVIGVDVDYTNGGTYEVEKTKIAFKAGSGAAALDYVVLTHAANKFKDICAAMESLRNGSYAKKAGGAYVFTELMSGNKTFWDNEFGIVGAHMVNTTL